jgi:DnaJ-class molecular chaperone
MENFYKILNVDENATQDEIKKAYRKLSLLNHPDKNKNPDAVEKFKNINAAYQVIGDVEERKKYDNQRKRGNNTFFNSGDNMEHVDINDIFNNFFGNNMPPHMASMFGGNMGTHSFAGGGPNIRIFQNGRPVNINTLNKPVPIIKNLKITLEQSYNGDNVPLEVQRWVFEDNVRKMETETLYIPLKKGIDNNEMIVLENKGNIMNNIKGDIKIMITLNNNTEFKREGLNLILEKSITLKEALCGSNFVIKHISGKQLKFNNEPGIVIKDNLVKKIDKFGMFRDNNIGSLFIKFKIQYPDRLTKEQVEGLKELL